MEAQFEATLDPVRLTPSKVLGQLNPGVVKRVEDATKKQVEALNNLRELQRQRRLVQVGGEAERRAMRDQERATRGALRNQITQTRAERKRILQETTRDTVAGRSQRSEEHTSELQSLMRISYAVFCLK